MEDLGSDFHNQNPDNTIHINPIPCTQVTCMRDSTISYPFVGTFTLKHHVPKQVNINTYAFQTCIFMYDISIILVTVSTYFANTLLG
jgi:hypothetical protein